MKENLNESIGKMRSLIERMETPMTNYQATINEQQMINEGAPARQLKSAEEAFDILDKIGNNKFVSIGYVSGVKMQTPIKRKNPATNRMKSYPDWEGLASVNSIEGEIAAMVKITAYNLRYNNTDSMKKKYQQYADAANIIRQKYGLEPMGHKNYTDTMDYSNGVKTYGGENDALQGHTYSDQNTFKCNKKSMYYPINQEGHIIAALDNSQVENFLKTNSASTISGVSTLVKLNTEQSTIDAYINEINSLKMFYQRFEYSSILYVVATVDGQKIIYINDKLMRNVDGIDINPQDFIQVAKDRYAESLEAIEAETKKAEAEENNI